MTTGYFNVMSPAERQRDNEPPAARQGLDLLLAAYPDREIDRMDGQSGAFVRMSAGEIVVPEIGPWLRVWLDGEEFAIWKETGAVHRTLVDGSVEDDPFLAPRRRE